MISIREQSYGLNVALYNEFTLDDFRQLEEALLAAKQKNPSARHPVGLVHVERLHHRYGGRANQNSSTNMRPTSGRVAVITDDIWIKLGARLSSLLTNQHPKYFSDATEAQAWLLASNLNKDKAV